MRSSPPLRFLALVLGAWAAVRTAILAPPWPTPPADAAGAVPRPATALPAGPAIRPASASARAVSPTPSIQASPRRRLNPGPWPPPLPPSAGTLIEAPAVKTAAAIPSAAPPPSLPPRGNGPESARPGRWSLSAWAFVRQGPVRPLAPGGLLGASQAGARLAYRLNRDQARPLALFGRLASPLRRPAAAEAAFGVDWRPSRQAPIHFSLERRQALGREGRSAFALTAYGGVGDVRLGRFRIDAYVQAGMVGARSRDPFGDGAVRLSLPAGERLRLGGAAWAAAQPGASRLDLGPQASFRLPAAGRSVTLAADWRLRVAGKAEPGSGPTLTLATDF
ncbi:MAG TPA: hypothetical protein VD846_00445 [Allosphingosinicella sp.]|nr:hypothetical protein [Allosphingosinicella sp.]